MGKSPNEVGRYNTDAGSDHCNHPALLDARAKCFCLVKDPEKNSPTQHAKKNTPGPHEQFFDEFDIIGQQCPG